MHDFLAREEPRVGVHPSDDVVADLEIPFGQGRSTHFKSVVGNVRRKSPECDNLLI